MLSFHIQSKKNMQPKQINVPPKSLRSSLIMLTSSLCITLPLPVICSFFASTRRSVCRWHMSNKHYPFPWIWPVYLDCSPSEAFWLSAFSTPSRPVHHTEKPLMYAQRIKLKAHNYTSQQSGDSDPVTAEDKHENQTMQEATAQLWSPRLGWSGLWFTTGWHQVVLSLVH